MSGPELRQFGLLFGAILVLLFGLLLPFLLGYSFPLWPWVVALIFAALALLAPTTLTPFYRGWMRFGLIAAFINTRIIMFVLYYALFVPTGPRGYKQRVVKHEHDDARIDKGSN